MIEFKPVTLGCKPWVDRIVALEQSRSADYNFGNIYIWDKHYKQLISSLGDRMLTKIRYDGVSEFVFPIGSGPLKPAIDALKEFADFKGYPFILRGITENHLAELEDLYPGIFLITEDVSNEDYIYDIEKLSSFSGKALHGKKNHCNRFEAEHSWHFEPITRDLIPKCLDMLSVWQEDNILRLESSISYEHDAITRAFAAYEKLNLDGGVLFADDTIVGFTVGEHSCDDTFDVHFEKAVISINGAYPMVCREFSRYLKEKYPELKYINREDDMGIEALRISKRSYKPEFQIKKYTARWRDV